MGNEINELAELAHDGPAMPLTTTPVVGTLAQALPDLFVPRAELVASDEPPAWWADALLTD
jgi:hypothetical protein